MSIAILSEESEKWTLLMLEVEDIYAEEIGVGAIFKNKEWFYVLDWHT